MSKTTKKRLPPSVELVKLPKYVYHHRWNYQNYQKTLTTIGGMSPTAVLVLLFLVERSR